MPAIKSAKKYLPRAVVNSVSLFSMKWTFLTWIWLMHYSAGTCSSYRYESDRITVNLYKKFTVDLRIWNTFVPWWNHRYRMQEVNYWYDTISNFSFIILCPDGIRVGSYSYWSVPAWSSCLCPPRTSKVLHAKIFPRTGWLLASAIVSAVPLPAHSGTAARLSQLNTVQHRKLLHNILTLVLSSKLTVSGYVNIMYPMLTWGFSLFWSEEWRIVATTSVKFLCNSSLNIKLTNDRKLQQSMGWCGTRILKFSSME